MESIYEIMLDVNEDIIDMTYDILRIVTLQIITQALFCMNNKEIRFFNSTFIQTILFLCISIIFYWLIIKKVFRLRKNNKESVKV
jgi:hypothetical protein